MQIDLREIRDDVLHLQGEEPPAFFGLDDDPFLKTESPLKYNLVATCILDELLIKGALETEITCVCSRCAKSFRRIVREKEFCHMVKIPSGTEYVDLTEEARESILLTFPSYPVCQPGCRGLCSRCGADLNKGDCSCRPDTENRWDALNGLKLK